MNRSIGGHTRWWPGDAIQRWRSSSLSNSSSNR
jgi:hypothetical protein